MKPIMIRHRAGALLTPLIFIAGISTASAVNVDGVLDVGEGYTQQSVQTITSNWGANNTLAAIHTVEDGAELSVFVAGRVQGDPGNAILLFIDSKPGGVSFIPNNLITTGGEEFTINNLGSSDTAGFTFESGFEPDFAVRVYCDNSGAVAYVNRYNLQTGVRSYVGETVNNGLGAPSGFISDIRTTWLDVPVDPATAVNGVEMSLSLGALGVPFGSGQPVKLMAVLVNDGSNYGSNQVLGSKSNADDLAGGLNAYDAEADAGTQTISFTVDNNDTDGDGDPNDIDDDDDNDDLLDTVETNTGTFIDENDTGTDPLVLDTDGDGAWDGDEVLYDYFGFQTDPNKANYLSMAVPGSFNGWDETGGSGNSMTMPDMSFAGQFDWVLDYEFDALGAIQYKFAANGEWTNNWGDGGNDITSAVNATGIHTFTFNNDTLDRGFTRKTFASESEFLAAYGLTAGGDDDSDNILNEAEFAGNTDPTNADTDGDGLNDDVDPNPLVASRDIEFSVDMTIQESLGNFDPNTGAVVVKFFSGLAAGLPDLSLTEVGDTGIYTGTLGAFEGPVGSDFGGYKFFNTTAGAPNSGYEEGDDRNFALGDAGVTQTLPTVFFSGVSALPGYTAWADANAGGQGPDQDFDLDGVPNGVEYFMGATGSTFTANPQLVGGTVIWPRDPSANATFRVWTSENLVDWDDVTGDADTSDPNQVSYTPPTTSPGLFVRLEVILP
ncbi:MAG: hypothetical protein KDN05_10680 [Verrucomicrobiae bacterium]|nr:hypothetical protein [Verrucomicrobiae bacterium]